MVDSRCRHIGQSPRTTTELYEGSRQRIERMIVIKI